MQKKKTVLWKVLALGAVMLGGGGLVAANAAKTMIPRAQMGMLAGRLQKELNLTDDQRVKVRNILQDAIPKGIAIHDNMKLDPDDKRAQLKELKDATKTRVYAVLNTQQRAKADHWQQSVMAFGKKRLEEIGDQLKLTDAQRAQIRPILEKKFKQGQALRDDMTLTIAQKFAKGMELRKAARAEINEVLTPAQRAQLDTITEGFRTEARRRFGTLRDPN